MTRLVRLLESQRQVYERSDDQNIIAGDKVRMEGGRSTCWAYWVVDSVNGDDVFVLYGPNNEPTRFDRSKLYKLRPAPHPEIL